MPITLPVKCDRSRGRINRRGASSRSSEVKARQRVETIRKAMLARLDIRDLGALHLCRTVAGPKIPLPPPRAKPA